MIDVVQFERKFLQDTNNDKMFDIISSMLPEVQRATSMFCKTQSQFMDNLLTISHFTPIRNMRQILAEMQRIRQALGEAYFNIEKKKLQIEEKRASLTLSDDITSRRLAVEIAELQWQIDTTMEYVNGAIRKLTNYSLQYRSIQQHFNLENFTEEDFELEEERYHIAKAFEQGLNAARAHGGIVDEGNHIYFSQIGINGTVAQVEIANYLNKEAYMLSPIYNGQQKTIVEPTHAMQLEFLDNMTKKFKGCSKNIASYRGMSTMSPDALRV